ncbi:MAG: type II toxin-antitoxin system RelE family toxin [Planctomycetota bacterium]
MKPSVIEELEGIANRKDRRKVVGRIRALADDPRPYGCRKLAGQDRYRVRQGWYRIVYSVEDAASAVLVVKIGHRRDVYR